MILGSETLERYKMGEIKDIVFILRYYMNTMWSLTVIKIISNNFKRIKKHPMFFQIYQPSIHLKYSQFKEHVFI